MRRDSTFRMRRQFYEAPAYLVGQKIEVRFDPLDLAQVEIYSQGQRHGLARPVDPVLNAQLPSSKPAPAAALEPTGINFVELLQKKKQEEKE